MIKKSFKLNSLLTSEVSQPALDTFFYEADGKKTVSMLKMFVFLNEGSTFLVLNICHVVSYSEYEKIV